MNDKEIGFTRNPHRRVVNPNSSLWLRNRGRVVNPKSSLWLRNLSRKDCYEDGSER